jgi:chorismate synthase
MNMQKGKMEELSIEGRHDTCIALRVPVVVEAAAAIVMADFMLRAQQAGRIFNHKTE